MPQLTESRPISCLADVSVGQSVVVREILFDTIRSFYGPLGVSQGDEIHCDGLGSHTMHLHTNAGRSLEIDRFYACFVEVETATTS